MSVCIAACTRPHHDGLRRIVVCLDQKVSTHLVSAETENKFDIISGMFVAYAGSISRAQEIMPLIRDVVYANQAEFWSDPLKFLRLATGVFKNRLAESHCQAKFGISYDRLLARGKDELGSGLRRKVLSKIHDLSTEVQLIVSGFDPNNRPRIFKFDWDEFSESSQFACIGAGAQAAEHSLYRRRQNPLTSVEETVYNVWEAKKFGELSPSVGVKTKGAVFGPRWAEDCEDRFQIISRFDFLNDLYSKYGPRSVPPEELKLPPDMFQETKVK